MKKLLSQFALLGLTSLAMAPAMATFEGNIGVSSNYLWRGVTQTQDGVAVDGGVDYSHESGFYVGTWASSVDFGDDTSFELDFYGGYAGSFAEDFSYDVGYLLYAYPDAEGDIDFGELYASLGWKWFTLKYAQFIHAGDDVTPDELDNTDMKYLTADVSIPLSDSLSVGAHYGYADGEVNQAWYAVSHYSEYSLSLSKETNIGTVSFILADTDLPGDDAKLVLKYSYGFEL
ncbi:TorF family putative porin [Shewanella sedimentimangrovi]|uniref:TIGR02001 family outer membrane protein n=1 Tax=Shewanella sedimentimangrovi TaxID=2814293 RepID=A0ABX7QZA6_9GAMM|nr:TorF family putative porin [Shewanella sedimentimangrovi]QSX36774.1 hypothetical protein JYB85_16070 [Shewanella sedimentimangrovi]